MRVTERVLDVESTISASAERVAMTIDDSALAHIMSVLTDLYSDPEGAIIREYSTNALDAHTDAGQSRPIEVTTPSEFAPFLTIRDYGTGLSVDDIRDTFSRYGASTKRDSDDVVGMLGLGCKSALTYADSFTFTSTKDGRTVQVLVARDEDGAGSMSVVSDVPAGDTPNGTAVTIPAKRVNSLADKARAFFRFWTPGTVLLNGEAPARIDGLWLSDSLLLTADVDSDYVVMGNVPYPVPDDNALFGERATYSRYNARRCVAFVPIGAVQFTPSREALQLTRKTTGALDALRDEVARTRDASIVAQVASAKTPSDAVRLLRDGRAVGYAGDAQYDGRVVPDRLTRGAAKTGAMSGVAADASPLSASYLRAGGRGQRVKGERYESLPLLAGDSGRYSYGTPEDVTAWHLFEGFDAREMTVTKRDKLAQYLADKGLEAGQCVLVDTFTPDERYWLDGRTIHAWSDVDAIKLQRGTGAASALPNGRPRGSYDALVDGTYKTVTASQLDTDGEYENVPLYWTNGNQYQAKAHDAIRSGAVGLSGAVLLCLPAGRIEKLRRDFPRAVSLNEAAQRAADAWYAGTTKRQRDAYALQRTGQTAAVLRTLDAGRVNDPALADAVRLAQYDGKAYAAGVKTHSARLSQSVTHPDAPTDTDKRYPLLVALGQSYAGTLAKIADHTMIYVNAAYDAATTAGDARQKGDS